MLVVACNTVSAVALDMLRVELDVPVIGVIEPGAQAAVEATLASTTEATSKMTYKTPTGLSSAKATNPTMVPAVPGAFGV